MDWGGSAAVRALRQAQAVPAYARRTGCGIDEAADALADRAGLASDDLGRTGSGRTGDRAAASAEAVRLNVTAVAAVAAVKTCALVGRTSFPVSFTVIRRDR
jgi:hypothetical protein